MSQVGFTGVEISGIFLTGLKFTNLLKSVSHGSSRGENVVVLGFWIAGKLLFRTSKGS